MKEKRDHGWLSAGATPKTAQLDTMQPDRESQVGKRPPTGRTTDGPHIFVTKDKDGTNRGWQKLLAFGDQATETNKFSIAKVLIECFIVKLRT